MRKHEVKYCIFHKYEEIGSETDSILLRNHSSHHHKRSRVLLNVMLVAPGLLERDLLANFGETDT